MNITPLVPSALFLAFLASACSSSDGDNEGNADAGPTCSDVYFADSDGDGYGDDDTTMQACEAPDGFSAQGGDCDDSDAAIHPLAKEVCDGADNNCNGLTDSADSEIDLTTEREYFADSDGDGYGDPITSTTSCDQPSGYVVDDTDCDDGSSDRNPGAAELCDFFDNDCDDLVDDADESVDLSGLQPFYVDADQDGYGIGDPMQACNAPLLSAPQSGDCDDAESARFPGATEICDGLDNDCDGGPDGTPASPNQCTGFDGSFAGSYTISAKEKLGATVINDMTCNGTTSISINLSASPAVQGSVACTRVGGLILFDSSQSGTISADIDLDGNLTGTLVHRYNSDLTRSYSFTGSLSGSDLVLAGTGSLLPHPQSAVPWEVTFSANAD